MLEITKTINVSGKSTVKNEAGEDVVASTMNATIPNGVSPMQSISTTEYIQDAELYKLHKDECRKDYNDFRDQVDALASL